MRFRRSFRPSHPWTVAAAGRSPALSPLRQLVGWAGALLFFAAPAGAESEPPNPYQVFDRIGEALATVEAEYVEAVAPAELLEGALRGLVGGLDPHSAYFSREDLEIFEGDTSGRFGGIGVEVDFDDGEVVIVAPVEGSPAARAGLEPGDVIVAVSGIPISERSAQELIRSMRGPVNTEVRLTVRKKKDDALVELILVREEISVASVRGARFPDGVGYVRIKAFQEGTHEEFVDAIGRLRASGPLVGLILDLRNNPGGLVREAVGVADELLSSGVIYSTRHRGRVLRTAEAHAGGSFTRGALVVLLNEYSASAAELLAGALKDRKRGLVVGARSFGKGSVQTVVPLSNGSALKLTTALYYTPSGRTLQALGVEPDVRVDPGYVRESPLRVLRESDLEGHIAREGESEDASEEGLVPPTDAELHLGVARVVPPDPLTSRDVALGVAFRIVTGRPVAR